MSSGDTTAPASPTEDNHAEAGDEPVRVDGPALPVRFDLVGELGRGGMAVVLDAHDRELDRPVAIKVLRTERSARHAPRVRREAQAMARIDHPNVVRVYDVIESGHEVMVVMERLPGGSLATWMATRRDWRAVRDVFVAAGRGLGAVHAAGVVHRDFKPSNVLMSAAGQPKVADFGIAALGAADDDGPRGLPLVANASTLTATGAVMGTPAYMAPEQLRGDRVDALADQFSFCIALFEGLHGARPFQTTTPGEPIFELARVVAAGEITIPGGAADVPTALLDVVRRGLSPDPSKRWPTMAALCEALEAIERPTAPARPRRWKLAAAIGLGLAASAAIAAFARSPTSPARPATPPPPAAPADPLNLGLDRIEGPMPTGWRTGIGGGGSGLPLAGKVETATSGDARTGPGSLRIHITDPDRFGSAVMTRDAIELRGKRVVVRGWIRTDAVAEAAFAGLWVRVDGSTGLDDTELGTFDNMQERGLTGTAGWRPVAAAVDVPLDASELAFGMILHGVGTAWYDDLAVEIVDPSVHPTVAIAGVVVDPTGVALAGATVASWSPAHTIGAIAVTDAAGHFRLEVKPGTWGLSAVHAGGVAATTKPQLVGVDRDDARIALAAGDGVLLRGQVAGAAGDGRLRVHARRGDGDVFAIPLAADGRFEARVPVADGYELALDQDGARATATVAPVDGRAEVDLRVTRPGPAPAEVLAWARAAARPLEPAGAVLSPALVGARVIGLAIPVRDTREVVRLQRQVLEELAGKRGDVTVLLEASDAVLADLDRLLQGDGGDAKALVNRLDWRWRTAEVVETVEWMAAWNADRRHRGRIHVAGLELSATAALGELRGFLRRADQASVEPWLAPIDAAIEAGARDADKRAPARAAMTALAARFEQDGARWTKAHGAGPVALGRAALGRLTLWATLADGTDTGTDRVNIAHVDGLLAKAGAGPVLLLGHDELVGARAGSLGGELRRSLGDRYVAIGVIAGGGEHRTIKASLSALRTATFAPPGDEGPCAAIGARAVLDVRDAPAGPAHDWVLAATSLPVQSFDAVGDAVARVTTLAPTYDAVVCVGPVSLDTALWE